MPNSNSGRRKFLKSTAIAGSIGTLSSFAGCAGDGSDGAGNDGSDGSDGSSGDGSSGDGSDGGSDGESDSSAATWSYGTSGEGSLNHVVAQGFARLLDQYSNKLQLEVNGYGGSEEAIRLLGRGDLQLANGQANLGVAAYNSQKLVEGIDFSGDRSLENKPHQTFSFANIRIFWETLDDSIETVDDLRGKRVSIGPVGSGYTSEAIFTVLGILDEIETLNHDWSQMPIALQEGRVDVMMSYTFATDVTAGWHKQLEGNEDLRIVPYTEEQLTKIQESQYFTTAPVPVSDAYGMDLNVDEIQGIRDEYVAFIDSSVEENLGYEFTKHVFENMGEAREFHAVLKDFNPENAVAGLTESMPVHPGSASYYQEEDLWDDSLEQG